MKPFNKQRANAPRPLAAKRVSEEQLSALFDGELSPRAGWVEGAVRADAHLSREFAKVEALDRALGLWREPTATPDVRAAVLARIDRGAWSLWLSRWGQPSWAAACVLGGLVAGMALWSGASGHAIESQTLKNMHHGTALSAVMTHDALTFPAFAEPDAPLEGTQP